MDNTEKLTNSKEIIAYIAERFPKCFTLEGEAKPLKIGIFQDLAERLNDDPKVSKTQLRAALRQYTSSWRYLHGVKVGAKRIDLDGVEGDELEQEHVEHAKQALAESKARVRERRKEQAVKEKKAAAQDKKEQKVRANSAKPRNNKKKTTKLNEKPVVETRQLSADEIQVGKQVNVNMGTGNMPASIVEVNKDEVRVRLTNGLTMLVKADHLRS
ncbi:RNA chaperone ProQ [Thaumasiovibrio sp. DFM-14]|uniref:RNA chaperone ProQ n=1 Tax=Thaumasiovibrio sp. DFM-14 TaxID=3384792 RepID=UPI0039A0C04D